MPITDDMELPIEPLPKRERAICSSCRGICVQPGVEGAPCDECNGWGVVYVLSSIPAPTESKP